MDSLMFFKCRNRLLSHTHTHAQTGLLSIHQSKRLISACVGVDEKEIRKFSMHIVRLIKRPKVTSSQVGWVAVGVRIAGCSAALL